MYRAQYAAPSLQPLAASQATSSAQSIRSGQLALDALRRMVRICVMYFCSLLFVFCQATVWSEPPEHQKHFVDQSVAEQIETPHRLNISHVPNAIRVHEKVISGGQPEGERAFQELRLLGIKTIISVDGAKPDVALARKYGMRYVHLPHSYQGIPASRIEQLAKAVRELDGPIFLHCHHGKHRSPTAAAVACVSAGLISPDRTLPILKLAGTHEAYQGLYAVARNARPLSPAKIAAVNADFPEVAKLPKMAESMVALEHTYDQLNAFAESGWRLNKNGVQAVNHEALLLTEHFTEMLRLEELDGYPASFKEMLNDSASDAKALQAALAIMANQGDVATISPAIVPAWERISNNCTACHRRFRDNGSSLNSVR